MKGRRHGTVLVFREGASEQEIRNAMALLVKTGILDEDYHLEYPKSANGGEDYSRRSYPVPYRLETFDEEVGGPVWYVP